MIVGTGRQLIPTGATVPIMRVETAFSLKRRRFGRSGRRFAWNRFLRVAVSIFPVSTPDSVEKALREGFSDPWSELRRDCAILPAE